MLRLRIVPAQGEPFDYVCAESSLVIGRSSTTDLVLADRFLSRQHARLFKEHEAWFVEDLGSRNTTLLNGAPVRHPMPLNPGDVIRVSTSVVCVQGFHVPREAEPTEERPLFLPAADVVQLAENSDTAEIQGEAALRRYADRLKLLNEVHRTLSRPISSSDLLDLILDCAFKELDPEEGVIFIKKRNGELERAVTRCKSHVAPGFVYSRRLVGEVADKGLAALVSDARSDERFSTADSIVGAGVRSLVAAPLLDAEGVLGMIVLSSQVHVRRFSEDDLELLVTLAAVAALRLRNAALAEEAARRRQLERELALAREIQVNLLPKHLPDISGYALCAGALPSHTVSGDFYKVVKREESGDCLLLVADVAGKGLEASLLTASLEALSAGPIEGGLSPQQICTTLSRHLHARTAPERYATAFIGAVELSTGVLRYASAGHDPAILLRLAGECERLGATGIPLGILESASYTTGETTIAPGDTLLVYTDGITEATDPQAEEYGLTRLEQTAAAYRQYAADDLMKAIEHDLDAFVEGRFYTDDRTLLILRRLENKPARTKA